MLIYCYLLSHSPSLQISPSTTAMVTCVEEAEVRAAARNVATEQNSCQFHQSYSASVFKNGLLRVHKWTCIFKYLRNDSHNVSSGTAVL